MIELQRYMQSAVLGFPGGSGEGILLPMQEMQVGSLGREDPLEKGMATHSSILAMDRGAWWVTIHGIAELDMTERLNSSRSICTYI